jgi:hypothetical protein
MDYAAEAKEALRLVTLLERQFHESELYCESGIESDGVWFRWSPKLRQIQYREDLDDSWSHVARVFKMEIPGILLKNAEALYESCLSEQSRVATVLSEATETGGEFADRLAKNLSEGNEDGRNIGRTGDYN